MLQLVAKEGLGSKRGPCLSDLFVPFSPDPAKRRVGRGFSTLTRSPSSRNEVRTFTKNRFDTISYRWVRKDETFTS